MSNSSWKRLAASAVMMTLSAGLVFGCGGSKQSDNGGTPAATEQKKPIKVGAVFILSGGNAGYGISQRAGVEQARDEINKAGGINGAPLEVVFEDSQGKPDLATTAVQKLIDKDNVVAIIGPTLSGEMTAAGPAANQAGVPILGVSTTAAGITDIGKYVFRNSVPEAVVLPQTVKKSVEAFGLKKVGLVWAANDQVSVSGYNTFKAELGKAGITITKEASFNTGDQEFGAQVTAVLATNPDGIVVSSLYQEAALFMVQARKAGYKGPFIGGNGFNSPKLAEIAKDAAEGAVVGSPWFPGRDNAKTKQFVADFTTKNGHGPDQFAAQAYDGMYLVAEALKKGGTNRDKVRDALAAIKDFEGVTGKFSFDDHRDPVMTPYVLQIKGGQYVELKK